MIGSTFKLCVLFSIVSPTLPDQSGRKYSVEQEALKLYGQDFQTVLKRFRRTPDYLKILQDKLEDLKTSAKEISLQIFHYHHSKMEERVKEILPANGDTGQQSKDSGYFNGNSRRQMEEQPVQNKEEYEKSSEETSENKIQSLDNYKVFYSPLTVSEKNSMRDLGFEIAGNIIHKIFTNLSPSKDEQYKDMPLTKMPEERGVVVVETTEHPEMHEVQHASSTGKIQEEHEGHTQHQQQQSFNSAEEAQKKKVDEVKRKYEGADFNVQGLRSRWDDLDQPLGGAKKKISGHKLNMG